MYRLIFTIFLLLIFNIANAQKKLKRKTTIAEYNAKIESNARCLRRNTYSLNHRKLMFPFKDISAISIISFRDTSSEFRNQIPVINNQLDRSLVIEERILTEAGIDKLTDLIFNYGYQSKLLPRLISSFKCYDPHNGIIFFNADQTVRNYIEICFDCEKFRASAEQINLGELCSEKFKLLKKFFSANGVIKLSEKDIYNDEKIQ